MDPTREECAVQKGRPVLLLSGLSLAGWTLLVFGERGLFLPGLCGPGAGVLLDWDWQRLEWLLLLNPPGGLALSWSVMLLAMMPLLLAVPLGRPAAGPGDVVPFVAGYLAVWLPAGVPLTVAALALHAAAGTWAVVPALVLALCWQGTPARRACLERCRCRPGAGAGALRLGLATGAACLGTCWALMLAAMVAGPFHLPAMALFTLVLTVERLGPGPGLRVPGRRKPRSAGH
ncbi:DUF2182 domain-containing protein [Zavarzinia compransoris]|uniref:DUF2182 domain-containing protein n=1 Tax=Zavarzinia compransoris TaxID=1264899 RepID=A0A317E311_9PROT|nr:DUF2182 domain-containing protein [Zavarzinia compransoris]PWR21021.1 hypothetical protein DKG75_13620 [Zavarzinia compransoris]TDP44053.1 putative metal-binding membrane protein [Zavarzinia compransoris]